MSFCFQWMEILIEGSLSTPFLFVFHRQGGNRVYFSLGQTCEVGLGERNIRRWWWVGTLVVESNSIFVFIARKTRLVRCLGRSSRRRHRNCFRAKGFSCLFLFLVIKMKCKRVFTGAAGEKAGGDVDQIQPTERRQVALAAANEFQQLRTVSDDPAELAVAGSDGWYPEKKKRTFSKRYDSIEMRGVLPK